MDDPTSEDSEFLQGCPAQVPGWGVEQGQGQQALCPLREELPFLVGTQMSCGLLVAFSFLSPCLVPQCPGASSVALDKHRLTDCARGHALCKLRPVNVLPEPVGEGNWFPRLQGRK